MEDGTQETRKARPQLLVLVFLVVTGIGIMVLLQVKDDSSNLSGRLGLGKGAPAPDFTLPGLDGQMVSLSDYRGKKAVLLNIWATWCAPCVEEMPSMEKLYQALKGEAFEILAVSIDAPGAQAVIPFVKKHKLSFPVLTDTGQTMQTLYQATRVPESFIVGKDGMIVEKIIGPRDWATPSAISHFRSVVQRE